jgi:hypothetical protein
MRGIVEKERIGKEMDECPLTEFISLLKKCVHPHHREKWPRGNCKLDR